MKIVFEIIKKVFLKHQSFQQQQFISSKQHKSTTTTQLINTNPMKWLQQQHSTTIISHNHE